MDGAKAPVSPRTKEKLMHEDNISAPSRAQGTTAIPWPSEISDRPTTCCVALRVQITQDRVGRDVDILHEAPRVSIGEPEDTIRELIDKLDVQLEDALRSAVLDEIEAIGTIDPSCPIALSRLEECEDGRCVCLEALVLPVSHERAADLQQLQAGEKDSGVRRELGWLWAEEIEAHWRAAAPDGRLPVRYLEDAIAPPSAVASAVASPPEAAPIHALVAA
jgi:hypothetical protein